MSDDNQNGEHVMRDEGLTVEYVIAESVDETDLSSDEDFKLLQTFIFGTWSSVLKGH